MSEKKSIAPGGCVRKVDDLIRRQLKNSRRGRDGGNNQPLCPFCNENPVPREGDICTPCEEKYDCR